MEPLQRVAVVLGGASCVWDDLERVWPVVSDPVLIAVNDAGAHYPGHIDHWVSLHPEKFHGIHHPTHNADCVNWLELRESQGYPTDFTTWSRRGPEKDGEELTDLVDEIRPEWAGGSSGLAGARLGYEVLGLPTILCGIPMSETPHFDGATGHEDDAGNWNECKIHWPFWEKRREAMLGKVKSMSGRTRQMLGEPTEGWLRAD